MGEASSGVWLEDRPWKDEPVRIASLMSFDGLPHSGFHQLDETGGVGVERLAFVRGELSCPVPEMWRRIVASVTTS